MTTVTPQAEPAPTKEVAPEPGAVRSGAILFAATVSSVGFAYLFYLVAGRVLGTADYGALGALLALQTLVSLPFQALQMGLSREVSNRLTKGRVAEALGLSRSLLVIAAVGTVVLVVVFLALVVPLSDLLNLGSVEPLLLVAVAITPAILLPVVLGDIQGRQQFKRLAVATGFPMAFRFVVFAILLAVGWKLYGAIAAMAIAAIAGLAVPLWWRRELLTGRRAGSTVPATELLYSLVPVIVGLLAVTALTNVDVLLVKARFSSHDAGIYAAASAFAKVAFFMPMAIVSVIFPRVAARRARGEDTADILGRSLVVTIGFCAVLFTAYGLIGGPLVRLTYGSDFSEAASILGFFGAGMTFFSIANILVSYHLSRHDRRFAWVVAAGAIVQIVLLAVIPVSLDGVLWVNAGVGFAILAAHELMMGSSLPAIRAGLGRVWVELELPVRAARVPGRLRALAAAARRPLLEAAAVLAACTALVVAVTWPLAAHLGDRIIEGTGDVLGTAADFWRQAEFTGYHVTGTTMNWMSGAPFGWEQGNGVNVQSALPYFPAYLMTEAFGPVVAFNVIAMLGIVLSGAAMYWLVRRLTGSIAIAAWAGLVFMVFPWHIGKMAHASLAHLEGFPLLVLALIAWYREPRARSLVYIGLTVAILWTTSGYYGIIGLLALAVLLPIAAWFQRSRLGGRRALGMLAASGGVAAAVSVAVYGIALLGSARGEIAPERQVADLAYFGARIWEFFVPAPDSIVFSDWTTPWLLPRQHLSNFSETVLYVGFVTLVLALGYVAVSLWRWRRLTGERRFLLVSFSAMVVLAVLFMPPYPISLGSVEIPTPTWLLWKAISQFRVPTRWLPLLMTGLVCLGALGLLHLRDRFAGRFSTARARSVAGTALVVVLAGVSFVELSPAPPIRMLAVKEPPEYVALEQAPAGLLAEYPFAGAGEEWTSNYLFAQRYHRRPIVNGAAAGTVPDQIREVLIDPSTPGVASSLATLGVDAVITRAIEYPYAAGPFTVPSELGEGYELVGSVYGGGTKVWAVVAEPRPLAFFPYGFWYSERYPGLLPYQWMSSFEGRIEIVAPEDGRYLVHFQAKSYEEPRRVTFQGDTAWTIEVPPATTEFFIPIEVQRGRSELILSVDPGPTLAAPPDTRQISVYISDWVFEDPSEPLSESDRPLRPRLVDPEPLPRDAPQ